MDAIIGRYRVHLEDTGLLRLQHPTGISFELTAEETLGLLDFIQVYRQTLLLLTRDTDAKLERIVLEEEEEQFDEPL